MICLCQSLRLWHLLFLIFNGFVHCILKRCKPQWASKKQHQQKNRALVSRSRARTHKNDKTVPIGMSLKCRDTQRCCYMAMFNFVRLIQRYLHNLRRPHRTFSHHCPLDFWQDFVPYDCEPCSRMYRWTCSIVLVLKRIAPPKALFFHAHGCLWLKA